MFTSAAVVILALVPAFAQAAAGCSRSYTVKAGDYCDAISAANNASTYQLATVNADKVNTGCTNLAVGQSLCLGTTGSDCTATYVVQAGDICNMITSKFGINSTILSANNPQINSQCTNIYEGEVLCIAGSVQVPPAPASGQVTIVPPAPAATPVVASTSAQAASTPAPVNVAPAPAESDAGDDGDDCDDDDSDSSEAPAPASTTPPPAPATTAAPVNVAPSPSPTQDSSDDDDSNLPFCDEL